MTGLLAVSLSVSLSGCGDKSPTTPTPSGPTVTMVAPNSGTTFGGTAVTITGTKFEAGATVTIGGSPATEVAVQSPTSISAKTAQHAAGQADVAVTVNGTAGTLHNGFTYVVQGGTTNAPPAIRAIEAQGTRRNEPDNFADLNEEINVTATVEDAETAVDQLTYEWSAPAGMFSGTGRAVKWRAPGNGTQEYELKLTVIERYQTADANGLPVTQENRVEGTVKVNVHDSEREVGDMARTFLVDFSEQRLSPQQIIRNFTGSCGGTDEELGDVERNQRTRKITGWSVGQPDVDVDFGSVCRDPRGSGDACAYLNVEWRSDKLDEPGREVTTGVDQVSAVYEGSRWWLCSSSFNGSTTPAAAPSFSATGLPGSARKQ